MSKITSDVTKKRKQFVFKVSWKIEDITTNEEADLQTMSKDDGGISFPEGPQSPRGGNYYRLLN